MSKEMVNTLYIQAIKFIVIGIYATIINYLVFYVLYNFFNINYTIASAVGFIIGIIAGFPFNKNWTFKSDKKSIKVIIPYITVYCISLVLSLILLNFQVKFMQINPKIANFICICFTTVTNFLGTKIFVFKNIK